MTLNDHGYRSGKLRTTREVEHAAFSQVTRMLRQSAYQADNISTIQAVQKNTELWSILAFDLAEPGNSLPDNVKAGLISLAGFAVRHGQAVMAGTAAIDTLIDINLSVMRGLRGEGSA